MLAKFVGSHIHKDTLKAGIALYPSESDKSYAVQYVPIPIIPEGGYPGDVDDTGQPLDWGAYNAWLESLPTKMVLNPAFTHFIRIDPKTTLSKLEAEIQRIFTPDVLTSADEFLSIRGTREQERRGFSSYRKMMANPERLGNGLVLPKGFNAEGLLTAANNKFKGLGGELDGEGKILDIKPGSLDIGSPAIDRQYNFSPNITFVNKNNPANEADAVVSVEMWVSPSLTDCEVATFSASGNDLTTRDSEAIGAVASGSKQTFSGLDMDAEIGDYIGYVSTAGGCEMDVSGGVGYWHLSGDHIPCTSTTFTLYEAQPRLFSLYGEGVSITETSKTALLTIGDAMSATRVLVASRTPSLSIGNTIAITRLFKAIKTAPITMGTAITVFKGHGRDALLTIGNAITATRLRTTARSSAVTIGDAVSAIKRLAAPRIAAITIGTVVSVVRIYGRYRTAALTIGVAITVLWWERVVALTLRVRSLAMTLLDRTIALTLKKRVGG